MHCDNFVLGFRTRNVNNDLKNIDRLFDFTNLDTNHELLRDRNKKVVSIFKIETPKIICIDEFIALSIKAYSVPCNVRITNKLKGTSKSYSKKKFVEFKK